MTPAPSKIAFAGGTLDRATQERNDGRAERLRADESSRAVLVGDGQDVAVDGDGGPLARVPVTDLPSGAELTFLGLEPSGAAVFACGRRQEAAIRQRHHG